MLEVGKLYKIKDLFLLLYPDYRTCGEPGIVASGAAHRRIDIEVEREYWSNRLKKPISYIEPGANCLVLERMEGFVQILAEEKVGWIICKKWMTFVEITQ